MRALMLIAAAALVLSCSRPAGPPGSALAAETSGRVAGPPRFCISVNAGENLHVLDPQTVAYGYGRTIYVNHLRAPCPALNPTNTVIVRAGTGGEYCRGDQVQGLEPGALIPGPQCNLAEWVPYTWP
jgi:hypothetical protein